MATGSRDLNSAFSARSSALPHPTRSRAVKEKLAACCGYFRSPRSRPVRKSWFSVAALRRWAGQANRTRAVGNRPVQNKRSGPGGGPSPDSVPSPGGVGFPPQHARRGGPAKSIRSEGTDRHLRRRRRAAPQCFAQRGASELSQAAANNNTSSKDPGHPPCCAGGPAAVQQRPGA